MPITRKYSCQKAAKLFDCWLDGELTTTQARDLSTHLAACPACREALEARKRLTNVFAAEETPVPPALHDAVMRRIHEEKRPFALPRLSRPMRALVGSLCAVALVVGVMLSPIGNAMIKSGMAMEDAAMLPSSAGKPNYSAEADLENCVPELDEAWDKVDSDTASEKIYTIQNTNITVAFANESVAVITDETGKSSKGSYKQDGTTYIIYLGDQKATFTASDNTLTPIEGSLFD